MTRNGPRWCDQCNAPLAQASCMHTDIRHGQARMSLAAFQKLIAALDRTQTELMIAREKLKEEPCPDKT